ncbi:hypothetical protein JTB14_027346 [Gonioctena quinquepunctata]|nr:hypothetical protein JTB14_027346 [Gonioctena quinquepunctata]
MTLGQESLVHELLILPHLTVDIILGMDILSNKFRIGLKPIPLALCTAIVMRPGWKTDDLRHKLATQVKETTKMVNHSTQTSEDPFEKNSYFHWKEIDSQKFGYRWIHQRTDTRHATASCCQTSPSLSDAREYTTSEEKVYRPPHYPR